MVEKIHDNQARWLKKMGYEVPAAQAFTLFEASSTCGTLTVLDSADPCFTEYGGNTSVVWAGAQLRGDSIDNFNFRQGSGGMRQFDMTRDCATCRPQPAPGLASSVACKPPANGFRRDTFECTGFPGDKASRQWPDMPPQALAVLRKHSSVRADGNNNNGKQPKQAKQAKASAVVDSKTADAGEVTVGVEETEHEVV